MKLCDAENLAGKVKRIAVLEGYIKTLETHSRDVYRGIGIYDTCVLEGNCNILTKFDSKAAHFLLAGYREERAKLIKEIEEV